MSGIEHPERILEAFSLHLYSHLAISLLGLDLLPKEVAQLLLDFFKLFLCVQEL